MPRKVVYRVWHECGGSITVNAFDESDAIEEFYKAIEGMLGHQLKICSCFGEPKPIDRSVVVRPIRVEKVDL